MSYTTNGERAVIDDVLKQLYKDYDTQPEPDKINSTTDIPHSFVNCVNPIIDDGVTIATSTFGEDLIKVNQNKLVDPFGDKGIFTGVLLRSTGMPHGSGRMIYEDGRTFEGGW